MSKKVSKKEVEGAEPLEIDEIIEPKDEFDLSILQSDIAEAEKERQELIKQQIMDQANFQKESENFREKTEKAQSFNDWLVEFIEFLFSFVNRKLAKVDVSKFDNEFVSEFVDKLTGVVPKDRIREFEAIISVEGKMDSTKRLFRISKLIMFISQEIYERWDQYVMYRKVHDKGKLFEKIKDKEAE